MPRRQHPQPEAITLDHLPEVHPLQPRLRHSETRPQQFRRQIRAKRLPVPREMIGVSMRYKGGFLCIPRIQPEIQLWQVDSTVKNDFNHRPKLPAHNQGAMPLSLQSALSLFRSLFGQLRCETLDDPLCRYFFDHSRFR